MLNWGDPALGLDRVLNTITGEISGCFLACDSQSLDLSVTSLGQAFSQSQDLCFVISKIGRICNVNTGWSTLIGRAPTLLRSHWSRAPECCWRQQSYAIKNQLVASKAPMGLFCVPKHPLWAFNARACSLWHKTAGASNTMKLSTNESTVM